MLSRSCSLQVVEGLQIESGKEEDRRRLRLISSGIPRGGCNWSSDNPGEKQSDNVMHTHAHK